MQQASEHTPEFQGADTRSWTSFFRLAERWESVHNLNRSDMLYELLQGYLRGELWPIILPNVYGGTALTAAPVRPYWMKSARRWPIETFTRLDFLRAAKGFAGLHLHFQSERIKVDDATGRVVSRDYADDPFAAGYHGLIGIPVDRYDPTFIETYIEKLTPSPDAVMRWCSGHGWPVPPGLSCSETDVGAVDPKERRDTQAAEAASTPAKAAQSQTENELKNWFTNIYVPTHKDDSPNPTRDAALSAARLEFANYCDQTHLRDDLRNIWRAHAPKEWKRTGPRVKTE